MRVRKIPLDVEYNRNTGAGYSLELELLSDLITVFIPTFSTYECLKLKITRQRRGKGVNRPPEDTPLDVDLKPQDGTNFRRSDSRYLEFRANIRITGASPTQTDA